MGALHQTEQKGYMHSKLPWAGHLFLLHPHFDTFHTSKLIWGMRISCKKKNGFEESLRKCSNPFERTWSMWSIMHFVSQSLSIDITLESCNLWSGMVSPVNAQVACCHRHMQTSFWLPVLLEPSSTSTYLVRFMPLFQCGTLFNFQGGIQVISSPRDTMWFDFEKYQFKYYWYAQATRTGRASSEGEIGSGPGSGLCARFTNPWHSPLPQFAFPSKRGIGKYGKPVSQF